MAPTNSEDGAMTMRGLVIRHVSDPWKSQLRVPRHANRFVLRLWIAALLVAGCGAAASTSPETSSDAGKSGYVISGSVSGEVRSGITITLANGPSVRTTTTDASGAYALQGLTDGDYVATAALTGYVFAPYAGQQIKLAGADVSGQNFIASATHHAIRGTVAGVVAAGVLIALSGSSGTALASVTTAADGTYAFSNIIDSTYTVTPSFAGYGFSPGARSVTLRGADEAGHDFASSLVTSLVHVISGTVIGAVMTGVEVALESTTATLETATTDASGAYAFAARADGTFTVTARLANYTFTPRSQAVVLRGADTRVDAFSSTGSAHSTQVEEIATGGSIAYGIAIGNDFNAWITDDVDAAVSRVILQDSSEGARGDVKRVALPVGARPTAIALRYYGLRCFTETLANRIGCVNWDATDILAVDIPTPASGALDIVNGPGSDSHSPDMWFAEHDAGKIGRMSVTETAGVMDGSVIAEYVLPTGCMPTALTAATDGNIWWAAEGCSRIGWIDRASGIVSTIDVDIGRPVSIAPNLGESAVWFVDAASDRLARLTSTGGLSWFSPPVAGSRLANVALGPDKALYMTEFAGNAIARYPLANYDPNADPNTGRITEELTLPSPETLPFRITAGTDGNMWFTERGQPKIGVIYLPSHCLSGQVTLDDLTTAVASVTLSITAAGSAGGTATTDGGGYYQLCGLTPGSYTVVPSLAARTFTPASLLVTMVLSNIPNQNLLAH